MLESVRLDYLTALGVTSWVPRYQLAHAAYRSPPELPAVVSVPEVVAPPIAAEAARCALVAERVGVRPRVSVPTRVALPKPEQAPESLPAEVVPELEPLPAFHLQLWLAGSCALLLEVQGPGLESAMPEFTLLRDILRAAGLPVSPHLYAEFQWPLTRNPQFDRSSPAASLALQAFMQARLESEPVVSLGCFGVHTTLLLGLEVDKSRLLGPEERLEQLPPAWFAPDLHSLMASSANKALLWQQLKRIMQRWQS